MPKKSPSKRPKITVTSAETEELEKNSKKYDKKEKWTNRERVLVMATRGITFKHRHLMKDLEKLMPHSKHGNKMERKENLFEINEMCILKNCNKCVLFDGRLRRDLYMWVSNMPNGPSAKFLVENIYTSGELKLTGNCLKGSRPLLSFDDNFLQHPQLRILKELFIQVFGVPYHHPKSQPFTDRIVTFSLLDNRIWYRNYQIVSEDGALAEIGPRFVLNPIRIFQGSFSGETLWENPHYVSPASTRRFLRNKMKQDKIKTRGKKGLENAEMEDELEVFKGNSKEVANRILKRKIK